MATQYCCMAGVYGATRYGLCVYLWYVQYDGANVALSRRKSVGESWDLTYRRDEYARRFRQAVSTTQESADSGMGRKQARHYYRSCPSCSCPRAWPDQAPLTSLVGPSKSIIDNRIATILYNVVDSTVGCMPVTPVDRDRDATPPVDQFLANSPGSWILEKRVYGGSDPAYDADKMHGLPVGIQVVGRAWEDEKVLGVMKEISSLVQYV